MQARSLPDDPFYFKFKIFRLEISRPPSMMPA
jgi:hypothetical protein